MDGIWCLTPLSTICQLYRASQFHSQFYWWNKPEYTSYRSWIELSFPDRGYVHIRLHNLGTSQKVFNKIEKTMYSYSNKIRFIGIILFSFLYRVVRHCWNNIRYRDGRIWCWHWRRHTACSWKECLSMVFCHKQRNFPVERGRFRGKRKSSTLFSAYFSGLH
jgi:hypothetical protein